MLPRRSHMSTSEAFCDFDGFSDRRAVWERCELYVPDRPLSSKNIGAGEGDGLYCVAWE